MAQEAQTTQTPATSQRPKGQAASGQQARRGNRIVFTVNLANVSQEAVLRLQGRLRTRNAMLALAIVCAVVFFATELMGRISILSVIAITVAIFLFIYIQVSSRSNMQRVLGEKLTPDAKLKRSVTLTRKDITIKYPSKPTATYAYDQVKGLHHEPMLCLVEFRDGAYLPIPHAELSDKKYEAILEMLEDGYAKAQK